MSNLAILDRPDPRPPAALYWAVAFNVLSLAGIVFLAAALGASVSHSAAAATMVAVPLIGLAGLFLGIMLSLRRGCAWAWIAQLVLLCLVVGVAPFPGLVLVPLLVAWCGPSVRDWFDPPMQREFA